MANAKSTLIHISHPEMGQQLPDPTGQGTTRMRENLDDYSSFLRRAAGGCAPAGTVFDVSRSSSPAVAASTTVTFATMAANQAFRVNGLIFLCVAANPGPQEFIPGANDTAAAVNAAAAINASTDPRIAGRVTASSAGAVLTLTSLQKGVEGNNVLFEPLGPLASGTVAYSGSAGAQTVTINGVSVGGGFAAGASDAATATAAVAAINGSTNALVNGFVQAQVTGATLATVRIMSTMPGAIGNAVTLAATGTGATASGARLVNGPGTGHGQGAQASGGWVSATGSGAMTCTINGQVISVTWATSDANTALLMAQAINNSVLAGVQGVVYASASGSTCAITSTLAGPEGNVITTVAGGSGASVLGPRLTGGAMPTQAAVPASSDLLLGSRLSGGTGLDGAPTTYTM